MTSWAVTSVQIPGAVTLSHDCLLWLQEVDMWLGEFTGWSRLCCGGHAFQGIWRLRLRWTQVQILTSLFIALESMSLSTSVLVL